MFGYPHRELVHADQPWGISKDCANAVRWDRKENWRWSLAEVHLPDVCKLGVPPSAPEKKEKLKQEEINSANDWETQRDGAGPAWEAAMPSGLLQCPCLCNAHICVTPLCVSCLLGVGVALSCV